MSNMYTVFNSNIFQMEFFDRSSEVLPHLPTDPSDRIGFVGSPVVGSSGLDHRPQASLLAV